MGMDLYGLNPHNPKKLVKPTINWDKEHTEEEETKFFEELTHYEQNVPGYYFRNNCWWWRPLWDYVYYSTDLLTEKEYNGGHNNDGQKISSKKSMAISIQLHKLIDSGHTKEYEDKYTKDYKAAQKHNKEIEKAQAILNEVVRLEVGDTSDWMAPINFPEHHKKQWERLMSNRKIQGMYPFSVENVREFANFCYQSGGFEIC